MLGKSISKARFRSTSLQISEMYVGDPRQNAHNQSTVFSILSDSSSFTWT